MNNRKYTCLKGNFNNDQPGTQNIILNKVDLGLIKKNINKLKILTNNKPPFYTRLFSIPGLAHIFSPFHLFDITTYHGRVWPKVYQ